MIYTLTLNPAIDYTVYLENFTPGKINRTKDEHFTWGGKGINVSRMLNLLGVPNVALGFVAGFTGKALTEGLDDEGIKTDFITLTQGNTRINVKIESGQETEINGQGPIVTAADLEALVCKVRNLFGDDILIISGKPSVSFSMEMYETLLSAVAETKASLIVDASGETLKASLKYKPVLIKPNRDELAELTGCTLKSCEDITAAARTAISEGASSVLVSMGAEGAVYVTADTFVKVAASVGEVYSTIGAGDSLLAGFTAGVWHEKKELHLALEQGVKCGSAVAFRKPGEALRKEDILGTKPLS